jgi:hypothetical protein
MSKKKKNKSILGFEYVEVLGHIFKIIETDKEELLKDNRNIAFGLARFYDNLIYVDTRQSVQNIKQVFYHELLHIIDWISHNEQCAYDEETINVLARGLMTVKLE